MITGDRFHIDINTIRAIAEAGAAEDDRIIGRNQTETPKAPDAEQKPEQEALRTLAISGKSRIEKPWPKLDAGKKPAELSPAAEYTESIREIEARPQKTASLYGIERPSLYEAIIRCTKPNGASFEHIFRRGNPRKLNRNKLATILTWLVAEGGLKKKKITGRCSMCGRRHYTIYVSE